MENTGYFRSWREVATEAEARTAARARRGAVRVVIPVDFSRALCAASGRRCWSRPTRPTRPPPATRSRRCSGLNETALATICGAARASSRPAPPFELRVQRRYNPEGITQYNIVPGLMGVVLTMTMVMMTALAMTRERERGTMENLLAMPVRPLEVMLGKIVPYIVVGYVQVAIILLAASSCSTCRWSGSCSLLSAARALHRRQSRRSASRSRRWRRTSCRRCRCRSSSSCRRCCCRASCSRSAACPVGAMDRRGAPAHAFPAHRARHPAKGTPPAPALPGGPAGSPPRRPGCRAAGTPTPLRPPSLVGFPRVPGRVPCGPAHPFALAPAPPAPLPRAPSPPSPPPPLPLFAGYSRSGCATGARVRRPRAAAGDGEGDVGAEDGGARAAIARAGCRGGRPRDRYGQRLLHCPARRARQQGDERGDRSASLCRSPRQARASRICQGATVEVGDGAHGWGRESYGVIVLTGSTPVLPDAFGRASSPAADCSPWWARRRR